jgi:hypothetical protein
MSNTPPTSAVFRHLLPHMKPGQSILVESPGKICTSYASQHGVKITTEVCLVISDIQDNPEVVRMTRVTKL